MEIILLPILFLLAMLVSGSIKELIRNTIQKNWDKKEQTSGRK